jgi:Glycosyl hydrolase family 26
MVEGTDDADAATTPDAAYTAGATEPAVAAVPRTRAEAKAARAAAAATTTTTVTPTTTATTRRAGRSRAGEADVTHGRRAARPTGAVRRAEVGAGRVLSNRRAWGAALAVTLVLVVPGASVLNRAPAIIADDSLLSGGADFQASQQFPTTAPVTTAPDDAATAEATATATAAAARAKATAAAAATTRAAGKTSPSSRRTSAPASRSRDTSGPLPGISGARSGLPYASGLYMPGSKSSNAAAFGDWRGRDVDVVVDWPARQNWDDIENPDWLISAWKNTPYTKVWGVAPIPEDGSSSLASCAAGNNNSHWRTFGQNMKNSGYSNQIVIRLGWEFNGNWYAWSAKNPAEFAGCWRQIVGTVSAIAPDLRWDWNVNRGPNSVANAADAYPGDQYVDIIGIDSYDQYPGVKSEADWQTQYSGPQGLKRWVDFAKAHGKPFSVPEWGLYPTRGSNGGGDNALYISKMLDFFKANEANLAYEAYFNEPATYYQGAIFAPSLNPQAAARYKSLLGG